MKTNLLDKLEVTNAGPGLPNGPTISSGPVTATLDSSVKRMDHYYPETYLYKMQVRATAQATLRTEDLDEVKKVVVAHLCELLYGEFRDDLLHVRFAVLSDDRRKALELIDNLLGETTCGY